jgi:thioredoxin
MADGRIAHLNDDSFDGAMRRFRGPVVIDFAASWCGPCKTVQPHLQELAEEFRGRAHFVEVDVDEAGDLAYRFGVRSVPTFIVIRAGRVVDQMVGAAPFEELRALVCRHVD